MIRDGSKAAPFLKDPDATVDFGHDWTLWLAEISDTISSTPTPTVTGVTLASSVAENSGVVSVFVSGGTAGSTATITFRIVTTGGRTDERTVNLWIEER